MNRSWKQHGAKQQLYGHQLPISKTIQIRQTSHAEHYWRNKDKLISDVLLWTPSHKRASVGRTTRIFLLQLCSDTGYSLEDLPETMNDRDEWRESVKEIHASGTTWCWCMYICMYVSIQSLHYEQGVTCAKFLNGVKLVRIQNFPPKLFVLTRIVF